MSTTTDTTPADERRQVEEELRSVRSELQELERLQYSDPDRFKGADPEARSHWDRRKLLGDQKTKLEVRLGVLDRRIAVAGQTTPAPPTPATIALPAGIPPEAIPPALVLRYQTACLAAAERKPKAAANLAAVEAELEALAQDHRRTVAAEAARQRRQADEAEEQRQLAEGEATKRKVEAEVRQVDAERGLREASKAWAEAAAAVCQAGTEARNESLHDFCATELGRAVKLLPLPWSRRLITALGVPWRTGTRRVV